MDITDALAPTSDQLDAIELVNPRTFTIDTGSRLGSRDGKVVAEIRLVDFPRVWRPSKGMLDVLAKCWGLHGKEWVGRSVTLYNDPEVMFGKEKVGGVRISHLSHIDGPTSVPIRAPGKGGRKIQWPVKPLVIAAPAPVAPQTDTAPLVAAFEAAGIDQGEWLATAGSIVGRILASPADLTQDEVGQIVAELTHRETVAQTGGE